MARKTTKTTRAASSKTRRKAGTATPKLDAALLYSRQVPLSRLCKARMQQLEDSLKAATKEDAAVSADLNLDRQVLDIVIKL